MSRKTTLSELTDGVSNTETTAGIEGIIYRENYSPSLNFLSVIWIIKVNNSYICDKLSNTKNGKKWLSLGTDRQNKILKCHYKIKVLLFHYMIFKKRYH